MKNRKILFVTIILLTIGFAAVSTSLIINGNISFNTNEDDFDVYFSAALVDSEDYTNEIISEDKQSITYETKNLSFIGDTSILEYEVTNASKNYDAEVSVTCTEVSEEITLTSTPETQVISARDIGDGKVEIKLNKTVVDEKALAFTCTLNVNAVERTTLSSNDLTIPDTFIVEGNYVDEEGNAIANANLVIYSETPHYVTTDENGYMIVSNLERGAHEIYHIDDTMDNIKVLTKEEVVNASKTKAKFTTTTKGDLFFEDDSKITSTNMSNYNKYCENIVGNTWEFNYTGNVQEFNVICDGIYSLEVNGAGGSAYNSSGYGNSTRGSKATGKIELLNNTNLYIYVGGKEKAFNGGGTGGRILNSVSTSTAGSGATDIRLIKASNNNWYDENHASWNTDESLLSRIITAGGGGGARANAGRQFSGSSPTNNYYNSQQQLYGQYGIDGEKSNGNLGQGSSEVTGTSRLTDSGDIGNGASGGGGGGWYGGATSATSKSMTYSQFASIMGATGGSGKGYGIVSINGNRLAGTEVHAYCGTSYVQDGYVFDGVTYNFIESTTTSLSHSGNGKAKITLLSLK